MLRILLSALVLTASGWCSAWELQPDLSTLNFVSIKKNNIGEVHRFKQLSGNIDNAGKAEVKIALGSVDTMVAIRDERMQQFLFETGVNPSATYTVALDPALTKLTAGETKTATLEGELNLHGQSVKVPAKVSVFKTKDGLLHVTTVEPILVNAEQFGMNAGIAKLAELAALPSISSIAPVTFALTFGPDQAKKAK